jgi:hypothetical protein
MRRKLILGGILIFLLAILIAVGTYLGRAYGPTIQSFTTLSRTSQSKERQQFLTTVYPIIPKIDGYRVFRLSQYRVEAPYIEVRDCFPYPYITLNKIGNAVILHNAGSKNVSISLMGKLYTIGPGQKKSLTIVFPAIPAIYEYSCNGSPLPSGFIYAVSK